MLAEKEFLPPLQIETKGGQSQSDERLTIAAYALMHVYLSQFGGQPVTQQNKNELVTQYGYASGEQLRNNFTFYQNEDKRLELNTSNKRSADTHLQRYSSILPLLEQQNIEAFKAATKDLELLQNKYKKYH